MLIGFGLLAGVGQRLLRKAAGHPARRARRAAARMGGAAAGGMAVGRVLTPPPPPPGGRVQRRFRRDPIIGTTMEGGRALTEQTDKMGRPMVVEGGVSQRIQCPPGYVAITLPDGAKVCALKGVARAAGLWRPRRKPPISAGDWRKLQVAERVKKKAKKIASTAGYTCAKKGSRRRK